MVMTKLPKALNHEPLIDAVFEVRFKDDLGSSLADILPGYLFHGLEPKPALQRLPSADLPFPVRQANIGMKYAPIIRLDWDKYFISIGDNSLAVSCKLPYPKWPNFKQTILDIVSRVAKSGISSAVDRFSLKYVNVIEGTSIGQQLSKINMKICLGSINVLSDPVNLQVHITSDNIIHIISVMAGAEVSLLNNKKLSGIIVDVDSIYNVISNEFKINSPDFETILDKIRFDNKSLFFECLKSETIDEMGPEYE